MRYLVSAAFLFSLLTTACNGGQQKSKAKQNLAIGNVKYGGVIRYNETEFFKSLFPHNITEVVGHRITNQIYEGLVRLNPADLTPEPCLASSWEVSEDALSYTFHLRSDLRFHDDECFQGGKGRIVKASDFLWCLQRVCEPSASNQGYSFFKNIIAGAKEHYEAIEAGKEAPPVSGLSSPNDSTIIIRLQQPSADLLYRLALPFMAVFPKEAWDKYGEKMASHTVGTGPFVLRKVLPDEAVVLSRNENYWGMDANGNRLPYLDGIKVSFLREEKTEMLEFRQGNLDLKYRLPFDQITEILDAQGNLKGEYQKFQLQTIQELALQYYGFLLPDPVFRDKRVRQAFNMAIDRKKLVDFTVKGEGSPAIHGVVPFGFSGYDNTLVKGYDFEPEKARRLLAEAGYPNGKGFPSITLEINSGGGRNEKVAEAIQSMLRDNLGVNIEISQVIFAQHTENIETAKTSFWRLGWQADYPDPNNFLNLFYGKIVPKDPKARSYMNSFRYVNPKFDELFERALATTDAAERMKLYLQLDQMVTDDAPLLLIYYNLNRRLLQPWVRNLPANGMEYRVFREVWLDKQ